MNRRQHPYCYDGTDVLKNKEGLRDPQALERLERTFSAVRALTMKPQPISVDGYRAIHRHLLQDVYDWAGVYRTVDTGRGPAPFCLAKFIEQNMQDRFAKILGQKRLKGLAAYDFADLSAHHLIELNAIHPFLDGNGRTNRAFLEILGAQAGHRIDLSQINPQAWNKASAIGFQNADHSMMTAIVLSTITAGDTPPSSKRLDPG